MSKPCSSVVDASGRQVHVAFWRERCQCGMYSWEECLEMERRDSSEREVAAGGGDQQP